MKTISNRACALAVALSTAVGFSQLQAQTLEEIVITGTKRDTSLTDVAMSVAAVSPTMLEENGWNQASDLVDFIPNVTFYQNGTSTVKLNIRGVHSDGPNTALETPVAVFTDGIYGPAPTFVKAPLLDLQGVEIQRGPQATYYGQNATAGSLSFTSKRQSLDGSDGYVLVEGTSESRNKVDFAYGAPLTDNFALRLAGTYRQEDGHVRDTNLGKDGPESEDTMLRLSGVWQASDNTDVFFKIENYSEENDGTIREPLTCGGTGAPWGSFPCSGSGAGQIGLGEANAVDDIIEEGGTILPNGNYQIPNFGPSLFLPVTSTITNVADAAFMSETGSQTEATRFALEINRDFGNFTLTSLTGYESGDTDVQRDTDMTPLAAIWSDGGSGYDYWSEEIRLVSNGDNRLDWMVGVLMQKNNADQENKVVHNVNIPKYCNPLPFGPPQCFTSGDLLGGMNVGAPFGVPGSLGGTDGRWERKRHEQEDQTMGIFFDINYDITENLTLKFGARYTDVEKTAATTVDRAAMQADGSAGNYVLIADTASSYYNGVTDATVADGSYTESSTDPYVTLQYAVSDNANIYASWSNAFKAGGFTAAPGASLPLAILGYPDTYEYEGEKSESVEIGYKGILLDDRLDLNIAIFDTEFDGQHTVLFNTGTPQVATLGSNFSTVGIDTEQTGLEIDGRYAASDNLMLTFALGLLDATMDEASVETVYGGNDCFSAGTCPDTLIHAPEWTASFGASYDIPMGDSNMLTLATQMSFSDDYKVAYEGFTQEQAEAAIATGGDERYSWNDSWERINVRVAYGPVDGSWEVAAFGRNITDNRRINDFAPDGAAGYYYVTRPSGADYGVSLRYDF